MRIIFVGGNLYPYKIGGYEIFNFYLFHELKKYVKDINCISSYSKPEYLKPHEFIKIKKLFPSFIFEPLFIFIHLIQLKRENCVLVLTYARSKWFIWWPYPLLNKIFNIKYILIIHGGGLKKWIWSYPHKKLFYNASHIIGVSERICKEYTNRTGLDIEYIPPLIPFDKSNRDKFQERLNLNLSRNDRVLLFVGSLKKIKNPTVIIRAALELGTDFIKNNNLKFVFAGDGYLKNELVNIIENNGLSEYIKLLGNVEREKLSGLYNASDAFIIASEFEGTPIALLEAMFNGLYIIASDSQGISNILDGNYDSVFFNNKDEKELASKIQFMLRDSDYELKRKRAKEKFLRIYSYEKMVQRYLTIINNI